MRYKTQTGNERRMKKDTYNILRKVAFHKEVEA